MTDEFTDLYAKAEATIQGVGMHPDTAWPSYLRVGSGVFELPHENAAFIAAASPTVILSLIADLREARGEVERLKKRNGGHIKLIAKQAAKLATIRAEVERLRSGLSVECIRTKL